MLNTVIRKEHDVHGSKLLSEPRPQLYPLLEKISEINPDVRFSESSYSYDTVRDSAGNYHYYISEYQVTIKGENVGAVGYSSWGKACFRLSNERISNTLQRGREKKTSDVEKAVQIFQKYMKPSTLKETAHKSVELCSRALNRFQDRKDSEMRMSWRRIEDKLRQFALDNKDRFLQSTGVDLNAIEELKSISEGALEMYGKFNTGVGNMVKLVDDKYLVKDTKKDSEYRLLTRDQMNGYDLQSIGMMKLLGNEHAIMHRGYKIDDTLFVVFPESDAEIEPNIVSLGDK